MSAEEERLQLIHERKQLTAQYSQLEQEFEAVTDLSSQQQQLIESLQSKLRDQERHIRHRDEQASLAEELEVELAGIKQELQQTKGCLTKTKDDLNHAQKLVRGHDRLDAFLERQRAGSTGSSSSLQKQGSIEGPSRRQSPSAGPGDRRRIGSLDPTKLNRKRFQRGANKQPSAQQDIDDPSLKVVLEFTQEARQRRESQPTAQEFQQQQQEIQKLQDALDEERERAEQLARQQQEAQRQQVTQDSLSAELDVSGGESLAAELGGMGMGGSLADELGQLGGDTSLAAEFGQLDTLTGVEGTAGNGPAVDSAELEAAKAETAAAQAARAQASAEVQELRGQLKALQEEHNQLLLRLAEVPDVSEGVEELEQLRVEVCDLKEIEEAQAGLIEKLQTSQAGLRKQLARALADAVAADKELFGVHQEKEKIERELQQSKHQLASLYRTQGSAPSPQQQQGQRRGFSRSVSAPDAAKMGVRGRSQTAAGMNRRVSGGLAAVPEGQAPKKPPRPSLGGSPLPSPGPSPQASRNEATSVGLRRSASVGGRARGSPVSVHQLALPRAGSVSQPRQRTGATPETLSSRLSGLFKRFEASKSNSGSS
eukprot:m.110359 g.110359  ORF g.110359 m.110359 type:complete len:597 (-) comp16039_c0_seq2:31-1821(-)